MIKAEEAKAKAKDYTVKTMANRKAKTIEWLEKKVAPTIQAEAEKGMCYVVVQIPAETECTYALNYLKAHGYNIKYHSCGGYYISW